MLPSAPVRILVVDDFQDFRRFVSAILQEKPEWQVICEASDAQEAVRKAAELQPDLILLDIGLPKRSVRKKFSRKQLLAYTANLPPSLMGIEACSGAHFIGAALRGQGHNVRLIPAQFVKPFVKSNKNDFLDAEAIAESVSRQNMRFVPIKADDQLDLRALHRVRDPLVHRRTAMINQIRGFLLERGITFAKGPAKLRNNMANLIEDAEQNITPCMRMLLHRLWQEWKQLEVDITGVERRDRADL